MPQTFAVHVADPCDGTGQATSQSPQFSGSVFVLLHLPPQFCSPTAQTAEPSGCVECVPEEELSVLPQAARPAATQKKRNSKRTMN
jgi:hypothetical protein